MTAQEIQQAIATAISNSEHAKFEKVDSVPTAETAEDNVMYLVMNSESGFYDIYVWSLERLFVWMTPPLT